MPIDIWAEPCSTLAFWGYVFLCVAAVWYWSYAGLFENRKKLALNFAAGIAPGVASLINPVVGYILLMLIGAGSFTRFEIEEEKTYV